MNRPKSSIYIPVAFKDADGVRHAASDWGDLIAIVRDYRIRNNKPIGDPEKEIFEQVCSLYPRKCRQTKVAPTQTRTHLSTRLLTWLGKVVRGAWGRASDAELHRRAEICRKCPEMTNWRQAGCGTCKAIDKLSSKAAKGRALSELGGCAALGEDCRVSILIDQPGVPEGAVPAHCWRRK